MARAAAIRVVFLHGNILTVLKADALLAVAGLNVVVYFGSDASFRAHRFEQRNRRHVFLAPDAGPLSLDDLGKLKLTLVPLLVSRVDLLAHVLFEFLDAHVFGDCAGSLLRLLRLLEHEPGEDLFVGVRFTLLVCHVVAVGRLFVKLS